ncbi:MAG TPA: zf-HC2 domain-containing protein [Candidatus Polarisedimenticolia bacterium]|nr:zf-HC2 domain-containing protein [Candidatus Polarisedimenticolia bacterium]
MISCAEVLAELSSLLDDQVPAGLRSDLEAHIAGCRTCTVLYDSMRKTLTIVTEARTFDLPEDLSERMAQRILARVRGGPARPPS